MVALIVSGRFSTSLLTPARRPMGNVATTCFPGLITGFSLSQRSFQALREAFASIPSSTFLLRLAQATPANVLFTQPSDNGYGATDYLQG